MIFSIRNLLDFTQYTQLVQHGIHIGHSYKNTLNINAWMVYGMRINLIILSLLLFKYHFRAASEIISFTSQFYRPVWFVNLDPFYDKIVKFAAMKCGEFFVSSDWIRGMVSNYRFVTTAFRKLKFYSELVFTRKDSLKEINFKNWAFTRFSWPRTLFVSSVHNSYLAVKESLSLSIPSLGIVDSNAFPQSVAVGIPGNDESIESLMYYNDVACNFVLRKKFKSVMLWFLNVRRTLRLKRFSFKMHKKLNAFFRFISNDLISFKRGFDFFYSWGNKFPENVDDSLFFYQSKDLIFDVDFNKFESCLKYRFVFWRSFSFLSHFWSGGRNFFQIKKNYLANYMIDGVKFISNKIFYKRNTFYFKHSLARSRGRFFLIHNRYWTNQGSSHWKFPRKRHLSKFFNRKGLYWSLYTYFFLSEGLSIFLIDAKFFRVRYWYNFIPKLYILNNLSSVLNFPVSSFFVERKGVLNLIKKTFKSHSKLKYIYDILYQMFEYIYNNYNYDYVYLYSLSLFFYNIWKGFKRILFFKKLSFYYSTIKRVFPYFSYGLNFKLYNLNKIYVTKTSILNRKVYNIFKFIINLNFKLWNHFLIIRCNFSKFNTKMNRIFFLKIIRSYNFLNNFIKNSKKLTDKLMLLFKNSYLFSYVYKEIRKSLLLRNNNFLVFLNSKVFWGRLLEKASEFKRTLRYKYNFFLSRNSYSIIVDKRLLQRFSNWFLKIREKSFFFIKMHKFV